MYHLNLCLSVYDAQRNGKFISWAHLQELVNKSRQSSVLSLLKITKEHSQLDSYSRMRVNLAAQVGTLLTAFSNHFIAGYFEQSVNSSIVLMFAVLQNT